MVDKILSRCAKVHGIAVEIYRKISSSLDDDGVKQFYNGMLKDEEAYLEYWIDMDRYAKDGLLPEVFEQPERVLEDLDVVVRDAEVLMNSIDHDPELSKVFYLTYKLEFVLLHPAFDVLFRFAKLINGRDDFYNRYKYHLQKIVVGLQGIGNMTREIELVGEVLLRLWEENCKLSTLVITDELTGVLNRRGFFQTIIPLSYLAQRNNRKVVILILDIDNFKEVNDSHGHLVGDKILVMVAKTIEKTIRASDVLARFGGEEFIIFLASHEANYISVLAEKIIDAVRQISFGNIGVTASIGASVGLLHTDIESGVDGIISSADENLYRAKRSGKNRACY